VARYYVKSVFQGTTPWVVGGTVTVTPPLAVSQSGVWSVGRTWTLNFATDSVSCVQVTSPWIISGAVTATQSGAWTTGRTWALDEVTDSVACMPTTYNMTILGAAYFESRNTGTTIQLGDSLLLTNAALSAQDVANTFMPLNNLSTAPSIHGQLSAQPKCWFHHIDYGGPVNVSATDCVLHTITINRFPSSPMIITIVDGGGTPVATITTPGFAVPTFWTPPVTLTYDVSCLGGLTVAVAAMAPFDVTVAFVN